MIKTKILIDRTTPLIKEYMRSAMLYPVNHTTISINTALKELARLSNDKAIQEKTKNIEYLIGELQRTYPNIK